MNTYTKEQVRRGLVNYQNLDHSKTLRGAEGARKIMEKIRTIQYDPLNVVGRNADLVLQARIQDYNADILQNLLYEEHFLVDGFDKEMCIYITKDYEKFSYVRQRAARSVEGTLRHRRQLEALEILQDVKEFVAKHGMTGAKDISIGEVRGGRWGHRKLSSAALDYLYTRGDLAVAGKRGTQKQFNLSERVIPEQYFTGFEFMSFDEFLEWYAKRRIASVGMLWNRKGGAWQGAYLYDNELRNRIISTLVEKGELQTFYVEGVKDEFYCCDDFIACLNTVRQDYYARFLAPLDNMLWDRKMVDMLFDFSYSWEVYVPVEKRKYGYYVLPVLYNDKLVARFEAVPVNECKSFQIKNWWWENGVSINPRMIETIMREMERFSAYLDVNVNTINRKKLEV